MSELKLKREIEICKELFNFSEDEIQLNHLKERFTNYIKDSKNGTKNFIVFLDFYSKHRPHQPHVSKGLIEVVNSCFPEQINEIQQEIKKKHKHSQIHHISRRISNK